MEYSLDEIMKLNLIPIEDLINETIQLSNNPIKNEKRLEEIRTTVIRQIKIANKYDIEELKRRMVDPSTSDGKYYELLDRLDELKKYANESDKLSMIIDRRYSKLNSFDKRIIKNPKLVGYIAAGVLSLGLGGYTAYNVLDKYYFNNNTEIVSEKDANDDKGGTKIEVNEEPPKDVQTNVETKKNDITPTKTNEKQKENKKPGISEAEQRTIVDLFKEMNDDASNYDGSTSGKSRIKGFVVNTIDFVFFNSSINGITFSDLKDDFKSEIYNYLRNMDSVIMSFDPDYKEALGDKYNAIKDFSKEKLDQAKYVIINHLGEDRYNSIISAKNEIIDTVTEGLKKYGGKALEFLKEKYDEWKDK